SLRLRSPPTLSLHLSLHPSLHPSLSAVPSTPGDASTEPSQGKGQQQTRPLFVFSSFSNSASLFSSLGSKAPQLSLHAGASLYAWGRVSRAEPRQRTQA